MKHMIRILAVLSVIALMTAFTACGKAEPAADPTSAPAVTEAPTQAPADATTEAATEPAATQALTEAPTEAEKAATGSDADSTKAELTDGKWKLTEVYINGEKYQGNYYGTVVKQTGAYIEFKEDDTFKCVLGMSGCSGTYTLEDGIVTLHITTKYAGNNEGETVDETETLIWDREAGTIKFNFNDVTNVFEKM